MGDANSLPFVGLSHPVWGAWIEIYNAIVVEYKTYGRTPYGVRGLKYSPNFFEKALIQSHPARGAWIEILVPLSQNEIIDWSHPARGAWIEI